MLEGRLIFHDGIRQWFELKLDQPQCGRASIQLVRGNLDPKPLEVLRGCRIKSQGVLRFRATGYILLDVFQNVEQIESVGKCVRHAPFPDFSSWRIKPDKLLAVRDISGSKCSINSASPWRSSDRLYRLGGGPFSRAMASYASYFLTGGFILWSGPTCARTVSSSIQQLFERQKRDPTL